jgi:syntaxin 18
VKRQLERSRTLGSGAVREALIMGVRERPVFVPQGEGGKESWLERAPSSLASSPSTATLAKPSLRDPSRVAPHPNEVPSSDEEDEELELSQSQILQFETENASILRSAQDTFESVQLAESRLMEISTLQMELVTHLTRQTELTNQLFEDAIATTSTVEKGNMQLREAKRRAKDSRVFILVFLIGASLSLLFLHYY